MSARRTLALTLLVLVARLHAASTYGPSRGTLVIVGGGPLKGLGIQEKFVELAGGPAAKIIVVPTAGGNRDAKGKLIVYEEAKELSSWKKDLGLTNVHLLHTADPKVADTEAFAATLRDATGVWFVGGRQWNLVDSYAGTLTEKEFHQVLARGGVIGGSSAGATIQGDYLVRGDTSGADVMMTKEIAHTHGFDFLHGCAIDQHINTRKRWDDLNAVVARYPNLLGIGLSEGTAIIVTGDRFTVMGMWKIAIHDNTRTYAPGEKPYYLLSAGDVYNMKTRQQEFTADGQPPVHQPVPAALADLRVSAQ